LHPVPCIPSHLHTSSGKRVKDGSALGMLDIPMPSERRSLRVVDLFCGAGGFSEGFRQMGFEVTYGVDIWKPAVVTHRKNHPGTEVLETDILKLSPKDLGKVDVLIGSPPCTQFSFANKGGKGDRAEGMKLVLRYLEFVTALKPRYWLMENVPRLLETLPAEVNLRDAGLSGGSVQIPRREILNSADYGAPQKRLRLVSGSYPLPRKTHFESRTSLDTWSGALSATWAPMRRVIEGLPDPLKKVKEGRVLDPNYPSLEIPVPDLTEHFYDSRMSPEDAETNMRSKTDHSWYGRMKFPDDLNKPARTIMATQLKSSRETIAIETGEGKKKRYRQPTVRECACLQSFPITYQFWGGSATAQYMLVGNAVPPLVSQALARAILEAEGMRVPKAPHLALEVTERPPRVDYSQKIRKKLRALPLDRRFRDHIPGSRIGGIRVDFDNMGEEPAVRPVLEHFCGGVGSDERHLVRWVARLYAGSGKEVQSRVVELDDALWELAGIAEIPGEIGKVKSFVKEVASRWPSVLPDATTLQGVWCERTEKVGTGPGTVVKLVAEAVDKHFPTRKFSDRRIRPSGRIPIVPRSGMQVRSAAYLSGAALAAEIINGSDHWLKSNWEKQYRPEEWGEAGSLPRNGVVWDSGKIVKDFDKAIELRGKLTGIMNTD